MAQFINFECGAQGRTTDGRDFDDDDDGWRSRHTSGAVRGRVGGRRRAAGQIRNAGRGRASVTEPEGPFLFVIPFI